jgi:hypothetical protein
MVVGERRAKVEAQLADDGIDLVEPPEESPPGDGDGIGRIAAALRAFESALGDRAIDRLVLAGESDEALAALLVATKRRVPVASIDGLAPSPADIDPRGGLNASLIAQLADATFTDDGEGITAWLRDSQAASGTPTGH